MQNIERGGFAVLFVCCVAVIAFYVVIFLELMQ